MGFIYLLFITQALFSDVNGGCTEAAIDACWTPMYNISDNLTWSTIVPTLPEQEMRDHCTVFDEVEKCVSKIISQCNFLEIKSHEGISDAYKWLCDDAFDVYLMHQSCYSTEKLHVEGKHCNESLSSRLNSLDSNANAAYNGQRICQYVNDYLDCVENAVTSFCGSAAAKWQRTFDNKVLEPLLNAASCQLDKSGTVFYSANGSTKTVIIIAIMVVFTTVLILVIVIILVVFKKRKAFLQHRRAHLVTYTANGNVVTANMQPGIQHQAGPLPQKMPEPPPYDPNTSPPMYDVQQSTSGMTDRGATGTIRSNPPPYRNDDYREKTTLS